MDTYEYELPDNFEDEEIDEDAAFNSEDERLYGHIFEGKEPLSGSEVSPVGPLSLFLTCPFPLLLATACHEGCRSCHLVVRNDAEILGLI